MSMKLFRNLTLYRLTKELPILVDLAAMNAALARRPARDPGSQELATTGFAPAYKGRAKLLGYREEPTLEDEIEPKEVQYVRSVNNGEFLLVTVKEITRELPGAGVRLALDRKIAALEAEGDRKVYAKERAQLRDEIIQASLPHALIREKAVDALIIPKLNLIAVDGNRKKAELVLSLLREAFGSLPVRPVTTKLSPSVTFTEWVKKGAPTGRFRFLDAVLVVDPTGETTSKVAAVGIDLDSKEIHRHVSQVNRIVTKLALAHSSDVGFLVDDKLQITKVVFSDLMHEQARHDAGDDSFDACMDATLLLAGRTLVPMLEELIEALGGEDLPKEL